MKWPDMLTLRPELVDQNGQLSDLQISLFNAVYQTKDVPYRDVAYYGEITEPTPRLVGFMADVTRRLGTTATVKALYHLDQGMGGGKSHALIGLYHLATAPDAFFATEIGQRVREEAELRAQGPISLSPARVVVLSADNMSPGKPSPEFGPARTLYERFLWGLFQGDKARYARHVVQGPDKAALQRALATVDAPVLILLDELMDYALALSDAAHIRDMPGEQAFLNALMDAVDELPRVAFVVVMMRSGVDEYGYNEQAEGFRDYILRRLERNGVTVSVTEAPDFAAIIRRRIFQPPRTPLPIAGTASRWKDACSDAWAKNVFDRLPSDRSLVGFGERLEGTYPFHPDLMALVRDDWSPHAGFQRVRSTVEIFAITAYYWTEEHAQKRWVPDLIGVGDIPLTVAIEQVLSSGLLHGNEKAIQMFRQVAAKDVTSRDGTQGRAVALDQQFAKDHPAFRSQPHPCVRMASALFLYSLVPRAQARRGATKAELLASIYASDSELAYGEAEEVYSLLVSDDEGLGALEVIQGTAGAPNRFRLTITQTLRMFFRQAKAMVDAERRDEALWERVKDLCTKGAFDEVIPVERPRQLATPLSQVFEQVDEGMRNRLVVLDPRRWTLLNGKDTNTRADITALFGLGEQGLRVDNAASCVVACMNTQRWDTVRKRANDLEAYKAVLKMLDREDELYGEAEGLKKAAQQRVDQDLRGAFQHFAFLIWTKDGVAIEWRRFDQDGQTALLGSQVWEELVNALRAVRHGMLRGDYLKVLLDVSQRPYTLKEVVRKFWQDPAFPLVPSEKEVRRAIHEALQGQDHWEIVDGSGAVLNVPTPEDLAIHSMEQVVRPAVTVAPSAPNAAPEGFGSPAMRGQAGQPASLEITGREAAPPASQVVYRRTILELPNRSVTQADARRRVYNLLSDLADVLDPTSGQDIQVIKLTLTITAVQGSLTGIESKAKEAGAHWHEEDEDF
jgi:uncharacterized protein DUF499